MLRSRPDNTALQPSERRLSWDLSRRWDVGQVGWPASVTDDLWFIDGPTRLELLLPEGRRADYRLESMRLRRDGGSLATVALGFPNQTLDEAWQTARRVAEEWDLGDRTGLDAWHSRRSADGGNTAEPRAYSHIRNDRWPAASLAVRPTYQKGEPWFVSLTIDFHEWTEEQRRTLGMRPQSRGS